MINTNRVHDMAIAIDNESLDIYIDNGPDKDPIHLIYYHIDEVKEDPDIAICMSRAIELFYTNPIQLIEIANN